MTALAKPIIKNSVMPISLYTLGLINYFSYTPYNFSIIILISFSIFLKYLFQAKTFKEFLLIAVCFIFGYYSSFMTWSEVDYVNYVLLSVPPYFTLIAIICIIPIYFFRNYGVFFRLILFATLWGWSEWFRGHLLGGIPWNFVSYTWLNNDILNQTHAILGLYGFNVVAIFILTTPAVLLLQPRKSSSWLIITLASCIFISLYTYGFNRLNNSNTEYWPNTKIKLIALNIKPPANRKEYVPINPIFYRYKAALKSNDATEISAFIFSEASLKHYFVSNVDKEMTKYNKFIKSIAKNLPDNSVLITGIKRAEILDAKPPKLLKSWNSMIAINNTPELLGFYDKRLLVPVIEHVPDDSMFLKKFAEFLDIGESLFVPGNQLGYLELNNIPAFAPLICFESLFPGDTINKSHKRPSWILVTSNDHLLLNTRYTEILSESSKIRAIEEGMPLARVTNFGINGVFDAYGRVIHKTKIEDIAITSDLPKPLATRTPYSLYGDKIFYMLQINLLLLLMLIVLIRGFKEQ